MKKKMKAFTLAEVLITLAIVGVVAALIMPNFIANYQKKQFLTRAKQTYVILNNAIERAKVDYGTDINNWEYLTEGTNLEKSMFFAERYLIPYLNVTYYCKDDMQNEYCKHQVEPATLNLTFLKVSESSGTVFVLSNSALVTVQVGTIGNIDSFDRVRLLYDVNGLAKPNYFGKDAFVIELGGGRYIGSSSYKRNDVNRFLPYLYTAGVSCDYYKTDQSLVNLHHACIQNEQRTSCLAYLMCNGWEIPSDYPW